MRTLCEGSLEVANHRASPSRGRTRPNFAELLRLDGRVFLLLGAGGGIGRHTAAALHEAGAQVACVDVCADAANDTANEVDGLAIVADVSDRGGISEAFRQAGEIGPVTGLVDVVGLAHMARLADLDDPRWDWQFDVVLRHAFLSLQLGATVIAGNGGGSMVYVGSMSGDRAVPRQTAYGAAKAALHHLVRCMGAELAPSGVRVNAVAPGFVRTPRLVEGLTADQWDAVEARIPRGSAGTPAEIAGPVLFLSSELSSYVTGQVLTADGGLTTGIPFPEIW